FTYPSPLLYSTVHYYSRVTYVIELLSLLDALPIYFGFVFFNANIGGLFTPDFQDAPWGLAKVWDLAKHLPVPALILGLAGTAQRSEEHTSELQSRSELVCRLLLEKKKI